MAEIKIDEKAMSLDEALLEIASLKKQLEEAKKSNERYSNWWCESRKEQENLEFENKNLLIALDAVFNLLKDKKGV